MDSLNDEHKARLKQQLTSNCLPCELLMKTLGKNSERIYLYTNFSHVVILEL